MITPSSSDSVPAVILSGGEAVRDPGYQGPGANFQGKRPV